MDSLSRVPWIEIGIAACMDVCHAEWKATGRYDKKLYDECERMALELPPIRRLIFCGLAIIRGRA